MQTLPTDTINKISGPCNFSKTTKLTKTYLLTPIDLARLLGGESSITSLCSEPHSCSILSQNSRRFATKLRPSKARAIEPSMPCRLIGRKFQREKGDAPSARDRQQTLKPLVLNGHDKLAINSKALFFFWEEQQTTITTDRDSAHCQFYAEIAHSKGSFSLFPREYN